ncbi:patched domain-containing protein 3-like [Coregonus clupeaformis]|uniref:patched domain-containing protein 3-like n=1 Tax=Coregonus clupeaformis TaxID=59861 RepID=UPI001E1C5358|nr:patched domain-containing protein 3-like [Coregonus clupeaformis]
MAGCNTDCVEKPIAKGFEIFGRFVGRHPWCFLILPMFISAGLGGGFYFLADREANGIEEMFTPIDGPAKDERQVVKKYFPQDDSDFSRLRLYTEGTFASLIIVTPTANILTIPAFTKIVAIDSEVKAIEVETFHFSNLCVKKGGVCVSNSIFDIVKPPNNVTTTTIDYPYHDKLFIASEVGGVKLKTGSTEIVSAKAIRLFYFLKEDNQTVNTMWLQKFIETASMMQKEEGMTISYFTSISRDEEFEKSSDSIIPLFSLTYALAITFSIISCLRLDCVRNKVWVATFGVLSAGMAVLSSFGLLLYCGMPFAMTVATAPFLILGIGVDDMFIMISCWQKTQVHDDVEDRMAATYKEAAVSITITTLTDALAFYIGLLTPFGSVQSFCMYTGTAVLFCYLYNITFFGAFLSLNGRREKGNRHWLTCTKVPEPEENSEKYNICCVGGAYDHETGEEEPMPINNFFKMYYGPFLTNTWTKGFVILLYAGYLGSSIYGCFQIKEGIDLKNLAADSSYVGSYYDNDDEFFSEYGPNVMVVLTDSEFKYWDESARNNLYSCLQNFEGLSMVSQNMTISWLNEYLTFGKLTNLNLSEENTFKSNLSAFLKRSDFVHDVNFTDNILYASRMFIQTVNVSTAVDEKNMLNELRETANDSSVKLIVYHPAFIYFDQYAVIVNNTIQNIVVATLAMLVISLMLIPNPICSLWVTFAIASVIVGVAGFMAFWHVNLDSVSMINLVICIGFSVDFSAHISYAFVSSDKRTANEKAVDAVYHLGYPILQGAVSTILGVVVLSAAESYIFRTFFKIMFLVISFGVLHGIVFIPVFLSFFGICGAKAGDEKDDPPYNPYQSKRKKNDNIACESHL